MTTTMTVGKLAGALAAVQAELPTIPKSKTANTGKFSYSYADLADVTAELYPILSKHGLAFTCCPVMAEGGFVMRGVLLHTSGEQLVGELPIKGGDAQAIGSAITYMRRYLISSMVGAVTDDDEDGTIATTRARNPRPNPVDITRRSALLDRIGAATDMARMADWWLTTHHEPITDATDLDALEQLATQAEAHKQKGAEA